MKPPYAIGSIPSLSGHAIAYRWRSLPRVRRHGASKPQGSSERVLPWQITMDQFIFASLSHTHYWYEVGMLKVPAEEPPVCTPSPKSVRVDRSPSTISMVMVQRQYLYGGEKTAGANPSKCAHINSINEQRGMSTCTLKSIKGPVTEQGRPRKHYCFVALHGTINHHEGGQKVYSVVARALTLSELMCKFYMSFCIEKQPG